MSKWNGLRGLLLLAATVIAAGLAGAVASARSAAAPQNTAAPQISGNAREDVTLTAANGTWSGSPTSYAYQWRRCATDGTRCGDITGATKQTYLLVSGDVSRTVGVAVTAANADGKTTATSQADGRRRLEERLGEHRQAGGHRLGHGWRRAQGVERLVEPDADVVQPPVAAL